MRGHGSWTLESVVVVRSNFRIEFRKVLRVRFRCSAPDASEVFQQRLQNMDLENPTIQQ